MQKDIELGGTYNENEETVKYGINFGMCIIDDGMRR